MLDAPVGAPPVIDAPADDGEQVRAEPGVGPAAALEGLEDLGEGVLDGVVGGVPPGQVAGEAAGGGEVPFVEGRVGGDVTGANPVDQLRVAHLGHGGHGGVGVGVVSPGTSLHAC
nr:hypothetical protein [Actinomadura soli]